MDCDPGRGVVPAGRAARPKLLQIRPSADIHVLAAVKVGLAAAPEVVNGIDVATPASGRRNQVLVVLKV